MTMTTKTINLSVLIPVFNDEPVLEELHRRLMLVLPETAGSFEIILVDDASSDGSWAKIKEIKLINPHVVGVKLSRNSGQQNAIAAAIDFSRGETIVIMDSDLQDRPEDIPKLLDALRTRNAGMAIAKWKTRKDSLAKRLVSHFNFKVTSMLTGIKHEHGLGVFRAIRSSVIDQLRQYQETTSTTLSLLYWIGVDYITVELDREARYAGSSGYTFKKMISLSCDRIFGFSLAPIRFVTFIGFFVACFSVFFAILQMVRYLQGGVIPGWTSTIVVILLCSGVNFFFIGLIGEYLGRIFVEVRRRPKYMVQDVLK